MADLTSAASPPRQYGDEVRRMIGQYGPDAEMPRRPLPPEGRPETLMGQIGNLAKQVTGAAHRLAEARDQCQRAAVQRQQCEASFIKISEALMQAIHEHREGVPENVPYQP